MGASLLGLPPPPQRRNEDPSPINNLKKIPQNRSTQTMSPQRRLEERLGTFSVPLSYAADIKESAPGIITGTYSEQHLRTISGELVEQWQSDVSRVETITQQFSDLVSSASQIIPAEQLAHEGARYNMHGHILLCPDGMVPWPNRSAAEEEVYQKLAAHYKLLPGSIMTTVAKAGVVQRPKLRAAEERVELFPDYARPVGELLKQLSTGRGRVPVSPHYAKLWALHPAQNTTDHNYLFECTLNELRINPAGIPKNMEDAVVQGWRDLRKHMDYNVIDMAAWRAPSETAYKKSDVARVS
jgi:hypothetical protein